MHYIKNTDFQKLISKEKNARMNIRLRALSHIKNGVSRNQTAIYLNVSRSAVNKWALQFRNDGLDGLKEKPRSGRPSLLSEAQLLQFDEYVIANTIKKTGGRLKGEFLVDYIEAEFGVVYSVDNIYRLLHKRNFVWITSRSKHPKQDEEAQNNFKKICE